MAGIGNYRANSDCRWTVTADAQVVLRSVYLDSWLSLVCMYWMLQVHIVRARVWLRLSQGPVQRLPSSIHASSRPPDHPPARPKRPCCSSVRLSVSVIARRVYTRWRKGLEPCEPSHAIMLTTLALLWRTCATVCPCRCMPLSISLPFSALRWVGCRCAAA